MSESRVRENRMHGSMRRREATSTSRASTRRTEEHASRRPYTSSVGPRALHVRTGRYGAEMEPVTMSTARGEAVSVEYWGVRGDTYEVRLILGKLNDYEAPSVGLTAAEAVALADDLRQFAPGLASE
jgi:hypothetical protein